MTKSELVMCREFYTCGGELGAICEFLKVTPLDLQTQASKYGWVRPESNIRIYPSMLRRSPTARKVARILNETHKVSKLRIGILFGCSEPMVGNISKEDKWALSDKAVGRLNHDTMTESEKKKIRAEYKSGKDMMCLAREYGFRSQGPIRKILDYKMREKVFRFPATDIKRMKDLYLSGMGLVRIAGYYDVDASVVGRVLRTNNVKLRHLNYYRYCDRTHCLRSYIKRLTSLMFRTYEQIINPLGLVHGKYFYAIDHIYPQSRAIFNPSKLKNPINIWEVCHPANLQMLTHSENSRKSGHLVITALELRERIRKWNETYLDPYFIIANSSPLITEIQDLYGNYDMYGQEGYSELGDSAKRCYYKTSNSV